MYNKAIEPVIAVAALAAKLRLAIAPKQASQGINPHQKGKSFILTLAKAAQEGRVPQPLEKLHQREVRLSVLLVMPRIKPSQSTRLLQNIKIKRQANLSQARSILLLRSR